MAAHLEAATIMASRLSPDEREQLARSLIAGLDAPRLIAIAHAVSVELCTIAYAVDRDHAVQTAEAMTNAVHGAIENFRELVAHEIASEQQQPRQRLVAI